VHGGNISLGEGGFCKTSPSPCSVEKVHGDEHETVEKVHGDKHEPGATCS
jgi:hypothetical protein